MTKRIARLALAGAAVSVAVLPAAPASAECWSLFTTPVDCVKEALVGSTPALCVDLSTVIICPPAG